MKIQQLPNWSTETLERRLPTVPAGTSLALDAGPGATAFAVKLDAEALGDPDRLNLLLSGALGVALDPMTTKRLNAFSGVLKDANGMYALGHAGHALPLGGALDGLAIVTSGVNFFQALHQKKGALHVTLAGAEVVANAADAFMKTTTTTVVATVVRNVARVATMVGPGSPGPAAPPAQPPPGPGAATWTSLVLPPTSAGQARPKEER